MEVGPGWRRVIFLTFFCSRMRKVGFRSHGLLEHREQFWTNVHFLGGFPGGSDGKESACNSGGLSSIPGLGRFPWRREWQPTPVFLPGEFYGVTESDATDTG